MTSSKWSVQVARVMHEHSNAAPAAPTLADIRQRHVPTRREPRMALTLVAVGAVIATAVGVSFIVRDDKSASVGESSSIEVHHARIEVTLAAQLECDKQIDTTGTFATMVIDSYSDRSGRQWRTQVTYPDGSTVDFIALGSAVYPTGRFQRGEYRGSTFGCFGPNGERFVLVGEEAQGSFFTLNVSTELEPDEVPYVMGFRENSTRIEGDHVDSQGRRSELWEQNIGGSAGYGSVADLGVRQVSRWWVDEADSRTVTEATFSTTVETLGSASQTMTLVANESIDVPTSFFDTTGYEELETFTRPDLHGSPTDDTIATVPVASTVRPLQLASAPMGLQLVGQGIRAVGGQDIRAAVFVKRDAQDNIIERVIARSGDLSMYANGDPLVVPPNLTGAVESIGYTSVDQQTRTVRVEYALGPLGLALEAYHVDEVSSSALSDEMEQIATVLDIGDGRDIELIGRLPDGWTMATRGIEPEQYSPSFYQAFEVDTAEGGPRIIIDNRAIDDPDYRFWEMSQTLQPVEIRDHAGYVTTRDYFASADPNTPSPNTGISWIILIWEEEPGLWVTMWVANTTADEAVALARDLVPVEQAEWPENCTGDVISCWPAV